MNQPAPYDWTKHQRDGAIGRMFNRRDALLRDVARSGGIDTWDHLKSHGHHHATRSACIRWGLLAYDSKGRLRLTADGRLTALRSRADD